MNLHERGSMNLRSLSPSKLDDLLVEFRDRYLHVMMLRETWHDADSVSIRRLRADGFTVVECARRRSSAAEMSLCVNHGGVTVVAIAGIRISAVDLSIQPTTFECVAARITYATSRCLAVVVYRPRSADVTAGFFTELADVLGPPIQLMNEWRYLLQITHRYRGRARTASGS